MERALGYIVLWLIGLLIFIIGAIVGAHYGPARAQDAATCLVLLVDASGSINAAEYDLQRTAYVQALGDPGTQAVLHDTLVAIVEFSGASWVIVPFTDAASASARYASWPKDRHHGGTNVVDGLHKALDLLEDCPGLRIIDISADGEQNVTGCASIQPGLDRAARMMVQINALVIEGEYAQCHTPDIASWYEQVLQGRGFVMQVHKWKDFQRALESKLRREVVAVPDMRSDG